MKKKTFIFNPARFFNFLRLFFVSSIVVSLGFMGYTVSPGWSSSRSSSSLSSSSSVGSNFNWSKKYVNGKMSPQYWQSITMSSDDTKLAACVYGGYIYTSTDGGITWTEQTSAGYRRWISIAMSSDGTKLAACVYSGYIYTSMDGGITWTEQTSAGIGNWSSIKMSSDGNKIGAVIYGDQGVWIGTR